MCADVYGLVNGLVRCRSSIELRSIDLTRKLCLHAAILDAWATHLSHFYCIWKHANNYLSKISKQYVTVSSVKDFRFMKTFIILNYIPDIILNFKLFCDLTFVIFLSYSYLSNLIIARNNWESRSFFLFLNKFKNSMYVLFPHCRSKIKRFLSKSIFNL